MATLAQISAALKSRLATATGTRPLHDYERYAENREQLRTLYKDPTSARLWGHCFFRESTRERDSDTGLARRLHRYRGYSLIAIDDAEASQKLLQDELEAMASAIRTDRTLGGTVHDVKDLDDDRGLSGLQIERVEPVMFAGVLCFRASWALICEAEEPVAP
jgi:hypothetical protein